MIFLLSLFLYAPSAHTTEVLTPLQTLQLPAAAYEGSDPKAATAFGSFVYFQARSRHPWETLWRTDGTATGTVPVTRDGDPIYTQDLFQTGGVLYVRTLQRELLYLTDDAAGWQDAELYTDFGVHLTGGAVVAKQFEDAVAEFSPIAGFRYLTQNSLEQGFGITQLGTVSAHGTGHLVVARNQAGDVALLRLENGVQTELARPATDTTHFSAAAAVIGNTWYAHLSVGHADGGVSNQLWAVDDSGARHLYAVQGDAPEEIRSPPVPLGDGVVFAVIEDQARRYSLHYVDATGARVLLPLGETDANPVRFRPYKQGVAYLSTDGLRWITPEGDVRLLSDAYPAAVSFEDRHTPIPLDAQGRLVFLSRDASEIFALMFSDGTLEGTVAAGPGGLFDLSFADALPLGDTYLALGSPTEENLEPYLLTDQGPRLLKEVNPVVDWRDQAGFPLGDRLVFLGTHAPNTLYATDGTEAGTEALLADTLDPRALLPVQRDGMLTFLHRDDQGRASVWQTDGTAAGTGFHFALPEEAADDFFLQVTAGPDTWTYLTQDRGYAYNLIRTDGTAQGTALVGHHPDTTYFFAPQPVADQRGGVYYAMPYGDHVALYYIGADDSEPTLCTRVSVDGTFGVTAQLTVLHDRAWLTVAERLLDGEFLRDRSHLVTSDGTAQGTTVLAETTQFISRPVPFGPQALIGFNLNVDNAVVGHLALTDGTEPLADAPGILPASEPFPRPFPYTDQPLAYAAGHTTLWALDAGSGEVFALGRDLLGSYTPRDRVDGAGGTLLMAGTSDYGRLIWTDGHAAGTRVVVEDFPMGPVTFHNGRFFFALGIDPHLPRKLYQWAPGMDTPEKVAAAAALEDPTHHARLGKRLLFTALEDGVPVLFAYAEEDTPPALQLNAESWLWVPGTVRITAPNAPEGSFQWSIEGGEALTPTDAASLIVRPGTEGPTTVHLRVTPADGGLAREGVLTL